MSNDLNKSEADMVHRCCVGCAMVLGVVIVAAISMVCATVLIISNNQ